jgi:FkbM family methyltransferase
MGAFPEFVRQSKYFAAMTLTKRLSFAFRSAADWPTCWQLWRYTLLFSAAIRWSWLYRRLWQNQQTAGYQILWNNKLLQLCMRPQDLPIFYEIYQDEAYKLPAGIKVPANAKVLDIGSHIGLFSHYYYHKYGVNTQFTALEPSPENFTLLQANLGGYPNINLLQKAVAPATGTAFLQKNGLSYNHRLSLQNDGVEVATINILELLESYSKKEKLFLLKMDVEGMEVQLIPLLRSKISALHYLLIEIHPPYHLTQLIADLELSTSQVQALREHTFCICFDDYNL